MPKTVRSPNYPVISLRDAVERVRAVWNAENRHPADKQTIARALGYGTLNGASMGVISALLKYGFLDSLPGGQLKISRLGIDVVNYGHMEPERVGAIKEAAFRPALFSELFDRYGTTLPSDENLRTYLVARKGFNPRTVDGVIRSYRDTISFLDEESGGAWTEDEPELLQDSQPLQVASLADDAASRAAAPYFDRFFAQESVRQTAPQEQSVPPEGAYKVLVFSIAEGAEARVELRGRVTQEAIDKLIKLLELQQDTFPKRAEFLQQSEQPQTLQPALERNESDEPTA